MTGGGGTKTAFWLLPRPSLHIFITLKSGIDTHLQFLVGVVVRVYYYGRIRVNIGGCVRFDLLCADLNIVVYSENTPANIYNLDYWIITLRVPCKS